jgi:lipid-A-disaccharide synthase
VNVAMVGHPFFDEIAEKSLDSEACRQLCASAEQRVALLPGSRDAEVRRNFPVMVEAARQLEKKHPHVRFHVACFKERHREQCRQVLDEQPAPLPVELHCGRTSEILETATCVLMVSGSVSLEVLMRRKPAVVIYRGTLFLGVMGLFFIHCKYMSLPNLMVDRMLLPEIPFVFRPRKQARRAAGLLDGWLSAPAERERVEQELHELQQAAGIRGGVVRAVDALLAGQARQPSARAA